MWRGIVAVGRTVALVALSSTLAIAGGTVEGSVTDRHGGVVPKAAVRLLLGGVAETKYRAETDSRGLFKIEGVAAGEYVLRTQFRGFREGALRINVHAGEAVDVGSIPLPTRDCDSPLMISDYITPPGPPPPPMVRVNARLQPGCAVDLDTGLLYCDPFEGTDLKFETAPDGELYLTFVNGAKLCDSGDSRIRIDGFGRGNDWCVETNAYHKARVFIDQDLVQPGSTEVMLFVVTR